MEPLLESYVRSLSGDGTSTLTPLELIDLTERYPTFAAPAISLLRHPDAVLLPAERQRLQAMVALNCRDIRSKAALMSPDGALLAGFYPPEEPTAAATTDDAIATFLETYGHSTAEEDALLEQMIFNPVADYGAVLERDEAAESPDAPDTADRNASIGAFLAAFATPGDEAEPVEPKKVDKVSREEPEQSAEAPEGSSLSESLAKIYIKQRRYDKAYEIISHLCLKNPKKSVYFADQLRFLRKLMLNSSFQQ